MNNRQKAELRSDVRHLSGKGFSKKEGLKILVEYGYVRSTASTYWNVFALAVTSEGDKE